MTFMRRTGKQLAAVERACEEKLLTISKSKEESERQLGAIHGLAQQTLLSAFPEITVSELQICEEWL